jgi:hypothetical protein
MSGIRHFLRNFTATAVMEHLRSQIEDTGASPELTRKEVELVRFIREGSFDWGAFLAGQPGPLDDGMEARLPRNRPVKANTE